MRLLLQLLGGGALCRYLPLPIALLACAASHAVQVETPIRYRVAEYGFKAQSSKAELNGRGFDVEWSYPVFVAGDKKVREALNAWLREISLTSLADCAELDLQALLRSTDRKVMELMKRHARFVECGQDQSVVSLTGYVGRYIVVTHFTEWIGATRPQHAVRTYFFDAVAIEPVNVESLFKPEALAVFQETLDEEIRANRPDCLGRQIEWSMVTLRPPASVSIQFPYNPAEWRACGDGMELIEGSVVDEQLLDPASFVPERRLEQVK